MGALLVPPLKIGVIMAFFSPAGIFPDLSDLLHRRYRGFASWSAHSFSRTAGMLSGPAAALPFSSLIALFMSSALKSIDSRVGLL